MSKNRIVRINSKLYYDLWSTGGDKLIAVYCTLKAEKPGIKYRAYKSKNNKFVGGLNLLRAKTSLTLHALKKYVPMLIDKGLCRIDSNGDFVLLGNEKTKELYSCRKLVPVVIGKNLTDTAYNSIRVRIHSAERVQLNMIAKKQHRRELIRQLSKPRSFKTYKAGLSALNKFGRDFTVIDQTVLSLQSYARIKDGSIDMKSKGQYWKEVLKRKGIISTHRRFIDIQHMHYSTYKAILSNIDDTNIVYRGNTMCKEIVGGFSCLKMV